MSSLTQNDLYKLIEKKCIQQGYEEFIELHGLRDACKEYKNTDAAFKSLGLHEAHYINGFIPPKAIAYHCSSSITVVDENNTCSEGYEGGCRNVVVIDVELSFNDICNYA